MGRSITRVMEGPLTRSSPYRAAQRPVYVVTERTPEPSATHAPIRSVWPENPAGKALTNARIRQYELDGRYGPERQRAAQARLTARQADKRRKKQNERFMRAVLEKYA